jgi:predicted protein tyrosine phosphatase
MKVLTICSAGTVRSVAMAHRLKHDYGIDAVPLGHDLNSQDTIDKMSDWADLILVMQPKYAEGILKRNAHKVVVADVGMDRWANPLNPELQEMVRKIALDLYQKGIIRKS